MKRDSRRMKLLYRGIYQQIADEETAQMAVNGVEKVVTKEAVLASIRRGNWRLQQRYAEIAEQRSEATKKYQALLNN